MKIRKCQGWFPKFGSENIKLINNLNKVKTLIYSNPRLKCHELGSLMGIAH